MKRFFGLLYILPVMIIISCNSNEIGSSKDVNPDAIYFDYRVWGQEGNDNVTVKLQFRFGGGNGTTLLLDGPGKVELDGEILKADSARMTGVYYEVQKPVASFSGKHIITFTDGNNKKYRETFHFGPITLTKPVPPSIKRGNLVFEFNGLTTDDVVRVLMTDTSFFSEEINRVDSVKYGRLIITEDELRGLSNGLIYLEITKESEREIRNGTPEGGRISVSYGLKREFILEN